MIGFMNRDLFGVSIRGSGIWGLVVGETCLKEKAWPALGSETIPKSYTQTTERPDRAS